MEIGRRWPVPMIVQRIHYIFDRTGRHSVARRFAVVFRRQNQFLQPVLADEIELASGQRLGDGCEQRAVAIRQQTRTVGDREHHIHQRLQRRSGAIFGVWRCQHIRIVPHWIVDEAASDRQHGQMPILERADKVRQRRKVTGQSERRRPKPRFQLLQRHRRIRLFHNLVNCGQQIGVHRPVGSPIPACVVAFSLVHNGCILAPIAQYGQVLRIVTRRIVCETGALLQQNDVRIVGVA